MDYSPWQDQNSCHAVFVCLDIIFNLLGNFCKVGDPGMQFFNFNIPPIIVGGDVSKSFCHPLQESGQVP